MACHQLSTSFLLLIILLNCLVLFSFFLFNFLFRYKAHFKSFEITIYNHRPCQQCQSQCVCFLACFLTYCGVEIPDYRYVKTGQSLFPGTRINQFVKFPPVGNGLLSKAPCMLAASQPRVDKILTGASVPHRINVSIAISVVQYFCLSD